MSDKVYRIKPLVWEKRDPKWYRLEHPLFGFLQIWQSESGKWAFSKETGRHDTLEAAQLAAEQWHRERMAAGLVEVQT